MSVTEKIIRLKKSLPPQVTLVAVSKTHPEALIREAYDAGQRIFGENRPQEMTDKYRALPKDIRWHFIGNLQTNKVKYIAPYVSLIQSADSPRLLETIDREARKNGRTIDVLLEIRIAQEATKHGWDENELETYLESGRNTVLKNVRFRGLMGMASFTEDRKRVRSEFLRLRGLFDRLRTGCFAGEPAFDTLSMGMSGDWELAVECGSTMVRIGSTIFGERDYGLK